MGAVRVERAGGVVTVILDRPERKNAITPAMFGELSAAARGIAARPDEDRVVVVTGAGADFCSGADVSEIRNVELHPLPWMRQVGEACAALHAIPQPVVAKVRGVCVGAGANLALGCDLVAADDTLRFSEIFVRRSLSIDFGGSYVLPRLVGMQRAKELALLGDIVDAATALQLGLVNRVVPAGELDALVDGWVARLVDSPPLALSMTKQLLNGSYDRSLDQALEAEAVAQALNFTTEDTAEAMAAFAEKREPRFRGR